MTLLTPRLCWAVSFLSQVFGSPDHDQLQAQVETITAPQSYLFADDRRLNNAAQTCPQIQTSGTLGPLRIGYELVDVSSVSTNLQALVRDSLMKKAAEYWGAALRVRQASAPLRVPRQCTSTLGGQCVSMASAPTCGPDVVVPDSYLDSLEVCTDVCSPGYQCSGACVVSSSCNCDLTQWQSQGTNYCCTLSPQASCPAACSFSTATFTNNGILCKDGCTAHPQGAGIVDKDMYVFVTIKEKSNCAAGGAAGSLASASWCVKDQCDRPIFANINFCPQELSLAAADLDSQVSTAVHELGHALGFSSSLYKYFRNNDGTPKIARDSSNQDVFPTAVSWYCAAGYQIQYPHSSGNLIHVDLSPDNIVKVFSERGFENCECPVGKTTMGSGCVVRTSTQTPTCVMRMVLPTVVSEVRDFFNCATLSGAELENQPTSDCSIFGSHWEQRVFNGEVMASTATSAAPTYLSRVTLALFQDSGWYDVDFSKADTLTVGVHWGYGQGCAFAENKCLTSGTPVNSDMFCSASGQDVCSLDRAVTKSCTISGANPSVPSQFDYGISNKLGMVTVMDFCPAFSTTVSNRVCSDTSSVSQPYNNYNFMREFVGQQNSRCFMSTLRGDIGGNTPGNSNLYTDARPTCYEVECASDELSYKVKVADVSQTGQGHSTGPTIELGTCTSSGQTLSGSFQGSVICASPAVMCQIRPAIHTQGGVGASSTTTSSTTSTTSTATTTTGTTGTTTTIITTSTTTTTTTSTAGTTSTMAIATTTIATTTMIATTTTTVTPGQGGVVTSSFTMSVTDAVAFAADSVAVNAVAAGIAIALKVLQQWVTLTVTPSRRLGSEVDQTQEVRRLAGTLQVAYTVTVPAGSTSVSTVASAASSITTNQLSSAVHTQVTVAKPNTNYAVSVTSKAAVAVDGAPFSGSSTPQNVESNGARGFLLRSIALLYTFYMLSGKEAFL